MVRSTLTPIVLAGPTGSGKSGLALALAERLGGEVVCADSRQVYEGMIIGAAAPSHDDKRRAPHVGYNVVPPEDRYDASRFLEDTDRYVAEVQRRGHTALLVGGSGLYLRSWRYGLADVPRRDDEVRARLEAELSALGVDALHARLAAVDPDAARDIQPGDPIRVVRALEIFEVSGKKPSELRQSHGSHEVRVQARWILLEAPSEWLAPRLERRARAMLDEGLVEEAVTLRDRLGAEHPLLRTMGYEEALALAEGALDEERCLEAIFIRQRQYAKRQRTWFKKEPWWTRLDARAPDLLEQVRATVAQGVR